jgi:cardiolipin synthase
MKGFRRRRATLQMSDPQAIRPVRQVAEQALSRASGAPLIEGNHLRVLEDAAGNYPVWLDAIRSARRRVYLENYIFDEDEVGTEFAAALMDRAHAGVTVRVVRDWVGTFGTSSRSFWRRMAAAGVDVRVFNPPHVDSPFGWISRDHRKMIAVDGRVAFVMGLCISKKWTGDPARGIAPWRDTGVEIRGPAVAEVEAAFAQVWEATGAPLPPEDSASDDSGPAGAAAPDGDVALRVLAGAPSTANLLRMDYLIAAVARRSLWLTDAYFVGVAPYVQGLRAAAQDGVDVRLLVPNGTDLSLLQPLSRAGYRPLLEAGVRIFEWRGSMLHAKTAVADGRWSRVGSSNLNLASFLSNYELDVAVENERVAQQMEQMYLRDLDNATEIVLSDNRVVQVGGAPAPSPAAAPPAVSGPRGRRRATRKGSTAAAGAIRVANAVGAAMTNHRVLGATEGRLLAGAGALLIVLGVVALLWPRVIAIPGGLIACWIGLSLAWRALRLRAKRRQAAAAAAAATEASAAPAPSATNPEKAEPPEAA